MSRRSGELHLLFPGQGRKGTSGRRIGGSTLVYPNFRNRYWKPALLTLDYLT